MNVMIERNHRVNELNIADNGERRKNGDRRQFSYTAHIPERRKRIDRRSSRDRRELDRLSGKK